MERIIFAAAALSGLTSVALGAFAAHALKGRLGPDMLVVFETGVRYQMYHALALLACAWAITRWPGTLVTAAAALFVIGTVLFSGSLYALSATGVRMLGAITPLGGAAFIGGWLCLMLAALRG